jgi:uncharacterized protein
MYDLYAALGLLLLLEGVLPFIAPHIYKKMVKAMLAQSDKNLRITGLVLMLTGAVVFYVIHNFLA